MRRAEKCKLKQHTSSSEEEVTVTQKVIIATGPHIIYIYISYQSEELVPLTILITPHS